MPQEKDKERDPYGWLMCNGRSGHDPDKLMPTQIIAGNALECMDRLVHSFRRQWNIVQFCDCPEALEANKSILLSPTDPSSCSSCSCSSSSSTTTSTNDPPVPGSNGLGKKSFIKREKSDSNGDLSAGDSGGGADKSNSTNGTSGGGGGSGGGGDPESKMNQQNSPLNWLADVALSKEERRIKSKNGGAGSPPESVKSEVQGSSDADSEHNASTDDEEHSTLRKLLKSGSGNNKSNSKNSDRSAPHSKRQKMETLGDVISIVIEQSVPRDSSPDCNSTAAASKSSSRDAPAAAGSPAAAAAAASAAKNGGDSLDTQQMELKHFIRVQDRFRVARTRKPPPVQIMIGSDTILQYPNIPHSWLCSGKLLRLHDPKNQTNYELFHVSLLRVHLPLSSTFVAGNGNFFLMLRQEQWKRGQPVIVSGVNHAMDKNLWHPDSFSKDFGDIKNDLVNCLTGNMVPNQPMKKFWDGFERLTKRLKDDKGQPMLLKLKVTCIGMCLCGF